MSTVLPFDFGSGYQVIRKIGQGASGRVFEGIDQSMETVSPSRFCVPTSTMMRNWYSGSSTSVALSLNSSIRASFPYVISSSTRACSESSWNWRPAPPSVSSWRPTVQWLLRRAWQWSGGENEMTPIYTTPFNSNPTSILTDITGGKLENVRLTDRCSGAVSITPDGHDVSALHPASCSIGAEIGNYQVQESPITIVAGGS